MTRGATLEYSESLLPTPAGYARKATLPWASLVFLLPLIVGVHWHLSLVVKYLLCLG